MNQNDIRCLLAAVVVLYGGGLLLAFRMAPKEWRWVVVLVALAALTAGCCIVPYVVGALH